MGKNIYMKDFVDLYMFVACWLAIKELIWIIKISSFINFLLEKSLTFFKAHLPSNT